MNEQRDHEFVQHSIDTGLSSIQGDPWLAQRIIASEKEGKPVKKIRFFALVMAAVVLLSGIAVAYAITRPEILNWLLGYEQASAPKQLLRKTAPIISPSELTALSMTAISLHFPTSWKTTSPINLQWSQLIAARLSTEKNWGWMSVIMLSGLCQIPTRMFFLFREILRMAVPGACQSVRR